MLYQFLKVIMWVAVKVFYKNIRISNLHYLPTDRPVLLASNHPNAFMDAIVLSVLVRQPLYYLVRSDVFNSPFKKWILGVMNMIPIYRIQEGADQLHKNEETFDTCNRLLAQKKTILVFSEGICIQERRLRKLRKGTARIAFGAEVSMNFKMGLLMVPVGLNYSNPEKFRSSLYINFGRAIEVSDFFDVYHQNKTRGVNELTGHLEKAMSDVLVVIEQKANDFLVAGIEEVYKNNG